MLGKLVHQSDMTMLVVTRAMNCALDIADHVSIFDPRMIRKEGPPKQAFQNPRQWRTREFLSRILNA